MTKEVEKALMHVRQYYPEVEIVIFNREGMWQYMSDCFECPIFSNKINQSILEEAADSVTHLPAIFQL